MYQEIDHVVETLRSAKDRGKSCALLLGAGCSVTAGIPTAAGIVEKIRERYPHRFSCAPEKTYPHCMAQLSAGERHDLIAEFADTAKINWAHLCIAQLMKAGFVDRVYTTNFDQLVARAAAMLGIFPAVYDFAASQLFKPADIPDLAVFNLHGQRTGFVLLNTPREVDRLRQHLARVFDDAGRGRVWIVVGYSGENDPVFEKLAEVPQFDNFLYWVGYREAEPTPEVRERLLTGNKGGFFLQGHDADSFFVTLTRALECFPPPLIAKPFSHLKSFIDEIAPFRVPGESGEIDVTRQAVAWIESAIAKYEQPTRRRAGSKQPGGPGEGTESLVQLFLEGRYEEVIASAAELSEKEKTAMADELAWSHVKLGDSLRKEAEGASGAEADRLWALAGDEYAAALQIKPGKHEALNNWGNALLAQAKTKAGVEADRLFELAGEKYAAALQIKPDKAEALNNWGNALLAQAKTRAGVEADRLFELAGEKYAAALQIRPDMHEALYNLGNALAAQAKTKEGAEADRLFELAEERYAAALQIKPDKLEALNNWGGAVLAHSRTKDGDEGARLLARAREMLLEAERRSKGAGAYNLACIAALRGERVACRGWLETSKAQSRLPSRRHLEADPDLDPVRDEPWFAELLDSLS